MAHVRLRPERVRSGTRGDLLIELIASPDHARRGQRGSARSLRLRDIGDQAVGFSDDECFVGRAAKYPEMFRISWLPNFTTIEGRSRTQVPPHRATFEYRARQDEHLRDWSRLMRAVEYPANRDVVAGNFFELTGEEYVQVEVDPEGAVVLWSSEKSLEEAISDATQAMGGASETAEGYVVFVSGETSEGASSSVEATALDRADQVALFVASFGNQDLSFSWRRPQIKLRKGKRPFSECSLAGDRIDVEVLSRICQITGSSEVSHSMQVETGPVTRALGSHAGRPMGA